MDNGASSYRRFLEGDDNSFAKIIDDYYDGLTLYLNSYVCNLNTAEELAEDTFVKLVTKKPRFAEKSSFKTWLYSIGRNLAIDYIRRTYKHNATTDDISEVIYEDEEIEQKYFMKERKITVHRAMRKLKAEYRQVIWLAYFENLSMNEISNVMKKSVNSVEHLMRRAKLSLKSELEKENLIL